MKVDYQDKLFVATIPYAERTVLREAGWSWSAERKRWIAADVSLARPFRPFMTDRAEQALDAAPSWLELSQAEDMDIDIPAPAGLSYDPFQKAGIFYAANKKDCLIADPMGLGKGGPLWAKILTPEGWTTYGDVKVGDAVVGSKGSPCKVTGVFDRGVLPIFKVTFSDGSSTHVDGDHLWSTRGMLYRNRRGLHSTPAWKTRSTRELQTMLSYSNGNTRGFRIPLVGPVEFSKQDHLFRIPPYTIGALLGDGGITHRVTFTSADTGVVDRISEEVPDSLAVVYGDRYTYRISKKNDDQFGPNAYQDELKRLGLFGLSSGEKFVPASYLYAPVEDRVALLRGLLDTDGYAAKDGTVQFTSNSEQLVLDVIFIVQSLGGTARKRKKISASGKDHHITTICMPEGISPFHLSRKNERTKERQKYPATRIIKSITPAGEHHVRCISVDAADHLYVTDDFIVTHNTVQAIGVSNYIDSIQRVLIVCPAHLKINWSREWMKWDVKSLDVGVARSVQKREKLEGVKTDAGRQAYRTWTEHVWPNTPVVICNYDMLPTFEKNVREQTWDLLICDEAQYIGNAKANRARHILGAGKQRVTSKDADGKIKKKTRPAVEPIKAKRRVFLSGTPIMSRPSEIWTLCQACDPDGLGKNWVSFVRRYCDAKKIFGRLDTSGASNLTELQINLRTAFMVRRDKESVLKQLPPKRRQLIELPAEGLARLVGAEISAAQRVREALREFERTVKGIEAPEEEEPWEGLQKALERRFGGLANLDYADRAAHLTEPEQVAFEEFSTARKELAQAKIPMVVEHLESCLAGGSKIVCFVVHTQMAEALKAQFPHSAFITGRVPTNKRQAEVDRFQTDPSCQLMIANMTAGGTGYTMTASSHVICAELDWVPAVVEQAEDRTWRRVQQNAVLVQHLAVEGSVDARLVQVLIEKMEITKDALDACNLRPDASVSLTR